MTLKLGAPLLVRQERPHHTVSTLSFHLLSHSSYPTFHPSFVKASFQQYHRYHQNLLEIVTVHRLVVVLVEVEEEAVLNELALLWSYSIPIERTKDM